MRRTMVAGVGLSLLLLAVVGVQASFTANQDHAALRALCERAARANQEVGLPPAASRGVVPLPNAAADDMSRRGTQELRAIYTGSLLARRIAELDRALAEQTAGTMVVRAAGTNRIDCHTVDVCRQHGDGPCRS